MSQEVSDPNLPAKMLNQKFELKKRSQSFYVINIEKEVQVLSTQW